jgi:hypothetical protein
VKCLESAPPRPVCESHATTGVRVCRSVGQLMHVMNHFGAADDLHRLISEQWDWIASDGSRISSSPEKCGGTMRDACCAFLERFMVKHTRWISSYRIY